MTTYFVRAGTAGTDAGTSWANAAESIPGLMTAQALAGGDIICVHPTHSYSAGAAITWTLPETSGGAISVICVDGGDAAWSNPAAMGTTVGTLTTGATESTNGNFAFTITVSNDSTARLYVHGITIKAGAAGNSSSADILLTQAGGRAEFQNCTLWVDSTSTTALLTLGATSGQIGQEYIFGNCILKFGATGQNVSCAGGIASFYNCTIAGTAPTTLFVPVTTAKTNITCYACDWSASTNVYSQAVNGQWLFSAYNCVIGTPVTGTAVGPGVSEFQACSPADGTNGADILSYYRESIYGVVEDDQSVYLTTGGAQGEQDDGTDTSYSLKLTPSSIVTQYYPLYTPWISVLVGSTGSKTVAMKIATTRAAALNKGEVWMEVMYMGEPGATGTQRVANSPHAQVEVDDDCPIVSGTIYRDPNATGTGRTDTSEAWTGVTETETNTLTATISCDEVGYIRCRVAIGKYAADATNPIYVDPKISVT